MCAFICRPYGGLWRNGPLILFQRQTQKLTQPHEALEEVPQQELAEREAGDCASWSRGTNEVEEGKSTSFCPPRSPYSSERKAASTTHRGEQR